MAKRAPIFSEPSFLGTFLVLIAAIAILFIIDTFLAKTEMAESGVEAAHLYDSGERFMQQGRSMEAAEQFKAALSTERGNQDYQLALGQALLAAGKLTDAETTLDDLLQRSPFGSAANLALARVLVKQNRINDAAAYYHRAIYGQWKENSRANQVKVRFELADLLSHQDSKEDLLAELLPLQDEAPDDLATKKKLGRLFIAAGSPARAADVFRDILRQQPQDAEAYAGLGEAEFASGNYRTAQAEFQASLRFRPDDQATHQRLDVCNRILELDPMRRGLSMEEQYRRARKLVELVLDDVDQCLGAAAGGPSQEFIDTVRSALKKPVTTARRSEAMDDNLDWADQLWELRKMDCKTPITPAEEPLALVLSKLAQ